jgi:hypothetical protein
MSDDIRDRTICGDYAEIGKSLDGIGMIVI